MTGDTYRRLRQVMGYDTRAFSKASGLSATYVSMMENGHKPVTELQAYKIIEMVRQKAAGGDETLALLRKLLS